MSEKKTRRLAAIMFTDIVGYTRLMQESETQANEIRLRHRKIFERYHERFNGQILQYYGDGTLSIFDSCVDAVHCAISMQAELQQPLVVPLRIGIHLGDIVKGKNDIYGDGVNVASRVESLGAPGAVLISGEVRKQVSNQEIETVSMGRFVMKNVAVPVDVFAIQAEGLIIPKGRDLRGKAKRIHVSNAQLGRSIRLGALGFVIMVVVGAMLFWALVGGQYKLSSPMSKSSNEEKIRWAYQEAIPKLEDLVDSLYIHQNYAGYGPNAWEAFQLARQVEKILPDDPRVLELKSRCSKNISIYSSPAGAKIYAKGYSQSDTAFQFMGTTPIEDMFFPSSYVSLKIEKEGFELINDAVLVNELLTSEWSYTLDAKGSFPQSMSLIKPQAGDTTMVPPRDLGRLKILLQAKDFLIDRHEVSNKEYLDFVKAGGYQKREYWEETFINNGKEISWKKAMSLFVDQTARPGPSTWIGGNYPEGEDDFPVEGVSWYEAAAYASFVGKQLPSRFHSKYLAGPTHWVAQEILEGSNLNANRSRERSVQTGQNRWGVKDIIGNVKEWCYNAKNDTLRSIIGGAYNDEDYLALNFNNAAPPFDRSPGIGFRCIQSSQTASYTSALYAPFSGWKGRNLYLKPPVSDEVFHSFLNYFTYDQQDLDHEIIYSREEQFWIREKVEFDAPYGNERMTAYLFLPKNVSPPFQTLLYWPGAMAWRMNSSEEFLELGQVDFLIKNGRAIVFPTLAGSYERKSSGDSGCKNWRICYKSNMVKHVQEFQKTIDYLETRTDIDMEKIAFIGKSDGANKGPIPLAVEKRLKAGIFHLGGLNTNPFPEVDAFHYCPRVMQPILMLNGKYDVNIAPYETTVRPMYDFLGTNAKDKYLKLYNEAHMVPKKEFIKESLAFLDKYLGPVKVLAN